MAKRDMFSSLDGTNLAPVKSLDVIARTAAADGVAIDMQKYDSLIAIVDVDARTDGTFTVHLEESADNSTFTDVAAGDIQWKTGGAVNSSGKVVVDGAADDDQAYLLGYHGSSRYVRISVDQTSASTGAILGGMLLRGHPNQMNVKLVNS